VRAALENAGYDIPMGRITVSLAPADLPKQGGWFDLPIALGILLASGQVTSQLKLEQFEFAGELALRGQLQCVRGLLPAVMACQKAGRTMVSSPENANEGGLVARDAALAAAQLIDVVAWLRGEQKLPPGRHLAPPPQGHLADLSEVVDQALAKRALEVAAAGGHNLLMVGPPGAGKSMLAQRLPGILPSLPRESALQVAMLHSVHGVQRQGLDLTPPFQAPHHSASAAALIGGGRIPKPGAVSLAHHGVLFLDELPEFERRALESLREPLETGSVSVARVEGRAEFPARFQLLAAMNPCPCGEAQQCRCTATQVERYQARVSGPLLDRIDLRIRLPSVRLTALMQAREDSEERSAVVRQRVAKAQARQLERGLGLNAWLVAAQLDEVCQMGIKEKQFFSHACEKLGLSARGYHRVLRVSRTIADLAGCCKVQTQHLAEAIQYRRFDPGKQQRATTG
jgi:magnesium chelatase family protein